MEQLKQAKAVTAELVAKIAGMEAEAAKSETALADASAKITALHGELAKRAEDLSAAIAAKDSTAAALAGATAELAEAKDTISGKMFRHVAGTSQDKAAAVAGGGEAGAEQKPFATKADALKAYDAIKRDPKAAQDFRRQHWAILGLPKQA